jgi:hypothetical protein
MQHTQTTSTTSTTSNTSNTSNKIHLDPNTLEITKIVYDGIEYTNTTHPVSPGQTLTQQSVTNTTSQGSHTGSVQTTISHTSTPNPQSSSALQILEHIDNCLDENTTCTEIKLQVDKIQDNNEIQLLNKKLIEINDALDQKKIIQDNSRL